MKQHARKWRRHDTTTFRKRRSNQFDWNGSMNWCGITMCHMFCSCTIECRVCWCSLSLVLGTSSFSSQLDATKGGEAPPSFYEYLDESDEEKVRQTCQSVPLRTMLLGSGTNPMAP